MSGLSSANRTRRCSPWRAIGESPTSCGPEAPGASAEPACGLLQVGLSANSRRYGLFACANALGRQMLGTQRQTDREASSFSEFAVHRDAAPMQLDQFLDQGEPDSAAFNAAAAGVLDPVKSFEQPRQLLPGNAGAGVAHRHLGRPAVRARPDGDRDLTLECELEGVGQEIEDDLLPHV